MRIAMVHFHLQTGGVTRVIEHACAALSESGDAVLVLAGEPPAQPLPGATCVQVPGLAYEEFRPAGEAGELARTLERTARDHFGAPPDLWHVHNPSLGKNLILPEALVRLARRGHRLLLQPHDFAEDGRPTLYARLRNRLGRGDPRRLAALLYPQAPQIHYAALNARDHRLLAAAGVPPARLHRLPNAVALGSPLVSRPHPFGTRRLWLYPTRAIRRKNLGELLLWAALAQPGDLFATTQAPQNPTEQPGYRRWTRLAAEYRLPLEFEVGNRVRDFPALLGSAEALVTTSVAEGFGLAFLEPWLVGRPLAGRDLPEVTADFRASGLDLDALYHRLDVPLEWLDAARLRAALEAARRRILAAYGREARGEDGRLWDRLTEGGRIDFGRLDEMAQEEVLHYLIKRPAARESLTPGQLAPRSSVVEANRALVEDRYSLAGYGRRLRQIYAELQAAPVDETPEAGNAEALLDGFLAPERLYLLRT